MNLQQSFDHIDEQLARLGATGNDELETGMTLQESQDHVLESIDDLLAKFQAEAKEFARDMAQISQTAERLTAEVDGLIVDAERCEAMLSGY